MSPLEKTSVLADGETSADPLVSHQHTMAVLVQERDHLTAEIALARRTLADLNQDIIAAETRHAQVAESTITARQKRDHLASEVIALCCERADLLEKVSALRIAAIQLEPPPLVLPSIFHSFDPPVSAPPVNRGATWVVHAQTTVKPRNDTYDKGGGVVSRQNEDRLRWSLTAKGVMGAIADGAGGSGIYCGAWAETLVNSLPDCPIGDMGELNRWLDGFCLDFRASLSAKCKSDQTKHSKFVREGSFATLLGCWIQTEAEGVALHWLAYGDSPLMVFDRTGPEPVLIHTHPESLAAFARDPYLLNWKTLPEAAWLKVGVLALPVPSTVILASDGIGQYALLRHLATVATGAMIGEFRELLNSSKNRLAQQAKAHAAAPGGNAALVLETLRKSLASEAAFAAMVAARCEEGLLVNDDASLIMIDIEPSG